MAGPDSSPSPILKAGALVIAVMGGAVAIYFAQSRVDLPPKPDPVHVDRSDTQVDTTSSIAIAPDVSPTPADAGPDVTAAGPNKKVFFSSSKAMQPPAELLPAPSPRVNTGAPPSNAKPHKTDKRLFFSTSKSAAVPLDLLDLDEPDPLLQPDAGADADADASDSK